MNRFLTRILLLVAGLMLFVIGAATLLVPHAFFAESGVRLGHKTSTQVVEIDQPPESQRIDPSLIIFKYFLTVGTDNPVRLAISFLALRPVRLAISFLALRAPPFSVSHNLKRAK